MPLSSAGVEDDVQVQRTSKIVRAGAPKGTSPMVIERIPPTYPADHLSIVLQKVTLVTGQRKRKLASDAFTVLKAQEEVHTIPASEANGTSSSVQPRTPDEEVEDVSAVLPDILGKPHRQRRSFEGPKAHAYSSTLSSRPRFAVSKPWDRYTLHQWFTRYASAAPNSSILENELEVTEIGGIDIHVSAEELVLTAHMNENTVTAGEKYRRLHEEEQRIAAIRKPPPLPPRLEE
ncbi:MAG: hypothetical protein LQ343_007593 [Gyalolechia ehrenbergii]|nr:MAG: hypothetical protein LQ343_007593 [Gyalolechia ehrenbergii]